jgi:hypothetical protein
MHIKSFFILIISVTSFSLFAQDSDPKKNIEDGALILAKQAYTKNLKLKAITLTSFVLEINNSHKAAKEFAATIQEGKSIRLYETLIDKGRRYSLYLAEIINQLDVNENSYENKKKYLAFISTITYSKSPAAKFVKDFDQLLQINKKFFPSYEPSEEEIAQLKGKTVDYELIEKMRGKTPLEISKHLLIKGYNYNPQKILSAINYCNKLLKPYNTYLEITPDSIPYDDAFHENDVLIYSGDDLQVDPKNISFRNVSLYEFFQYIEHTIALRFQEKNNSILITDNSQGLNRRPEHFQNAKKMIAEIKQSTIKARKKFDKKSIQLKGRITEIKKLDSKLLVEIDNHFVVEIDNKRIKKDTLVVLKKQLTEAKSSQYLTVTLRGIVNIKSTIRTYITDCSSLIADEVPYFYLKAQ